MFFSVPTEIWQLENGSNKIVSPALAKRKYYSGIGLYAVDFSFCST